MVWWILSAIAIVALAVHWRGQNAVWGTATLGALVGVVIAIFQPGFAWSTVGKAVVVATLIGLAFEWLPRLIGNRPSV